MSALSLKSQQTSVDLKQAGGTRPFLPTQQPVSVVVTAVQSRCDRDGVGP